MQRLHVLDRIGHGMGGAIVIEHLDDLASRHAELLGVHRVEFDVRQRVVIPPFLERAKSRG